jgi:hypothetical protein
MRPMPAAPGVTVAAASPGLALVALLLALITLSDRRIGTPNGTAVAKPSPDRPAAMAEESGAAGGGENKT